MKPAHQSQFDDLCRVADIAMIRFDLVSAVDAAERMLICGCFDDEDPALLIEAAMSCLRFAVTLLDVIDPAKPYAAPLVRIAMESLHLAQIFLTPLDRSLIRASALCM